MRISPGTFLMCIFTTLLLAVYISVILRTKQKVFYSGVKIVFAGIGLILIRMLLPFVFPFSITVASYRILPPINRLLYSYVGNTELDVVTVLFLIWIVGMIVSFVKFAVRQLRYRMYLRPFLVRDRECYLGLKAALEQCDANFLQVCIVPGDISPGVFGVRKPILILPEYLFEKDAEKKFEEDDLYYICRHEVKHCKNGDLWLKLFLDLVVCVQWFNPLAYLIRGKLTLLYELSNDQEVIRTLNEMQQLKYADCLLKVARCRSEKRVTVPKTLEFVQSGESSTEVRVRALLKPEPETKRKGKYLAVRVVNIAVVFLLLAATLVIVPEAYWTSEDYEEQEDMYYKKTENDIYLVKDGDIYQLYMDGVCVMEVSSIPEDLKDVPVIEREEKNEE